MDLVYASPMIRCRQTAKILWPKFTDSSQIQYVQNLQECDFGAFENKNYQELFGNAGVSGVDRQQRKPCRFPEASPMKHFPAAVLPGVSRVSQKIAEAGREDRADTSGSSGSPDGGTDHGESWSTLVTPKKKLILIIR